jgi:hypothetical protein
VIVDSAVVVAYYDVGTAVADDVALDRSGRRGWYIFSYLGKQTVCLPLSYH